MDVKELLSFKPDSTPQRDSSSAAPPGGDRGGDRGRKRIAVTTREEAGILKKPSIAPLLPDSTSSGRDDAITTARGGGDPIEGAVLGPEMTEEERLRIIQMVEDEPEVTPFTSQELKRVISVLEKRIARNQEMRIKFPDQPEKFMDSELELHESVQELHALATVPDLYSLAVDLNLLSILLGCLAHENADISCAVLDVLQELTDVDTINEAEESTGLLIDNLIDLQAIGLLTQNLDRLDESNKDEADGVHNTLAIFENLFEIRPELCSTAGQNGLLTWLLKRIRSRMPFDGNKLYAGEMLAILLQDNVENRASLGNVEGIDILLQQLATFKRHDPSSNEEGEYMENLFNCLCSALLHGPNRDKFLKGEGPQLMNLMLREKRQSRSGALKVLNHAVSGPDGTSNANKVVEILGLRTLFPLFMKTPKKSKRKGISALEHEEHCVSVIAGIIQHVMGPTRNRVLLKFEENDFEKVERLGELHFKYLSKVNQVDNDIVEELKKGGEAPDEDEVYLRRLDNGLFTLQLVDYIILETAVSNPRVKDRLAQIIQLRKGSMDTIKDIVREYADNLGNENEEWKHRQQESITLLLEQF
ncbi:beta-catenin-like protein 1 [Folsomia candida]|uniref:beta-catenin-like protein 1 n=1 Tax=Folsomia candida TaxID=158441 RepID=UPI000B8FB5CD|nr:beta-catenin-like protein 1 [Folsomia candida]